MSVPSSSTISSVTTADDVVNGFLRVNGALWLGERLLVLCDAAADTGDGAHAGDAPDADDVTDLGDGADVGDAGDLSTIEHSALKNCSIVCVCTAACCAALTLSAPVFVLPPPPPPPLVERCGKAACSSCSVRFLRYASS